MDDDDLNRSRNFEFSTEVEFWADKSSGEVKIKFDLIWEEELTYWRSYFAEAKATATVPVPVKRGDIQAVVGEAMDEEGLRLRHNELDSLVDAAWEKLLRSNQSYTCGGRLEIAFSFCLNRPTYQDQDDYMIPAADEDEDDYMIPAADVACSLLEPVDYDNDNGDADAASASCCICFEDLHLQCLRMPCHHVFHRQCIKKWLQTSHYCPICRYPMPTYQ